MKKTYSRGWNQVKTHLFKTAKEMGPCKSELIVETLDHLFSSDLPNYSDINGVKYLGKQNIYFALLRNRTVRRNRRALG